MNPHRDRFTEIFPVRLLLQRNIRHPHRRVRGKSPLTPMPGLPPMLLPHNLPPHPHHPPHHQRHNRLHHPRHNHPHHLPRGFHTTGQLHLIPHHPHHQVAHPIWATPHHLGQFLHLRHLQGNQDRFTITPPTSLECPQAKGVSRNLGVYPRVV